jgi:AraC family transcriptional regulator of adaptative response / DNA-3-methyladenine glycosylase II
VPRAHARGAQLPFLRQRGRAEADGFRPCLRCRPELAPGLSRCDIEPVLARAAARLLDEQPALSPPRLAARVGVTDRHLRRVFRDEFGVGPAEYARTQRLLAAKRLLTDTRLPVAEVARAAGFSSARRLEATFGARYGLTPSALRRRALAAPSADAVGQAPGFDLAYRPPLDWDRLLGFLERRCVAGVEHVEQGRYRRAMRVPTVDGRAWLAGWIEARPSTRPNALRVAVDPRLLPALPQALQRLRRLFDLCCDPIEIAAVLGPLAAPCPGLRLPGAVDGFELAVRAVLGQQVSVRAAHTLAGRVAALLGEPIVTPFDGVARLFPTAAAMADVDPARLAALGIVPQRARAIVALARAAAEGRVALDPPADPRVTVAALRALPGIGDWTAQYVAMRALAWPDAFPAADLGVLAALGDGGRRATPREAIARAEAWRPWRAYAVMHLWSRPA